MFTVYKGIIPQQRTVMTAEYTLRLEINGVCFFTCLISSSILLSFKDSAFLLTLTIQKKQTAEEPCLRFRLSSECYMGHLILDGRLLFYFW